MRNWRYKIQQNVWKIDDFVTLSAVAQHGLLSEPNKLHNRLKKAIDYEPIAGYYWLMTQYNWQKTDWIYLAESQVFWQVRTSAWRSSKEINQQDAGWGTGWLWGENACSICLFLAFSSSLHFGWNRKVGSAGPYCCLRDFYGIYWPCLWKQESDSLTWTSQNQSWIIDFLPKYGRS